MVFHLIWLHIRKGNVWSWFTRSPALYTALIRRWRWGIMLQWAVHDQKKKKNVMGKQKSPREHGPTIYLTTHLAHRSARWSRGWLCNFPPSSLPSHLQPSMLFCCWACTEHGLPKEPCNVSIYCQLCFPFFRLTPFCSALVERAC